MKSLLSIICVVSLLLSGCTNNGSGGDSSEDSVAIDFAPPDTTGVHDHPSEGPHQGTLIELGNEEYHAELVHDASVVTVYILDGSASTPTPIEAPELTINLIHDGKPAQFKLASVPDVGETPGSSSRFAIQSPELVEELEHDHSSARLAVLIKGKSYRGDIHHDHEGHDHDAHDHDHLR